MTESLGVVTRPQAVLDPSGVVMRLNTVIEERWDPAVSVVRI